MPIDTRTPGSPGHTMERLARKLTHPKRQKRLKLLSDWYDGDPPLPVGAEAARDAFQAFQREARSNFAELVVEATRERMIPIGIRTSADGDETGDAEAWRMWRRAGLTVESSEVTRTALSLGDAFVIVGPVSASSGVPTITAEDPRQVITEHDPADQRVITAALKLYHDEIAELDLAYLYLPGVVLVASRRTGPLPEGATVSFNPRAFEWDQERSGVTVDGLMPVHRFRNRRGIGEFEPHLDLLSRINSTILQRMTIAVLQAFRQRGVVGLPEKDKAGNVIDYTNIFAADPGALWQLPAGVEMWESGQVDLTPIMSAVKDDVQHLAAVSRTPMHMLMPAGANQSAEGASLQREGLVFKTEDRIARFTEAWSGVLSTAFRWMGDDKRADLNALDVLWKPPERLSLSERADAASKATDLPWRTKMVDLWGFSPDQVDRMEAERADDQLLQAALAQPAGGPQGDKGAAAPPAGVASPAPGRPATDQGAPPPAPAGASTGRQTDFDWGLFGS